MVGGKGRLVGDYLSSEDEGVLRSFVSEFAGQRLVPHLEAVLKNLNEWVSSTYVHMYNYVMYMYINDQLCFAMCTCCCTADQQAFCASQYQLHEQEVLWHAGRTAQQHCRR